jgi:hypothetical protein
MIRTQAVDAASLPPKPALGEKSAFLESLNYLLEKREET